MMRPLALSLAALAAAACGTGDTTTPTGPTTVTLTTETFAGSLAVGGSRFYSFSVSSGGTVRVTLASVTSPADGTALGHALEIGLGTPAGTGCATSVVGQAAPALVAQLLSSSQPGVRCVRVSDVGELTGPVNFAVRFTHP